MERLDHANARSAKIYGEIIGIGSGSDARRITEPCTGQGMVHAIRVALKDAGLTPEDPSISHVHAHGIGVPSLDSAEAAAIREVFRNRPDIPVTSTKGATGNMGAGNGGVELLASLLALHEGFVPPTIHCDHPVAGLGLNLVRGSSVPARGDTFLNINITRYGQSSCVVTRAWPKAS
ncbi:MAG: hypothetical protein ACKO0V_01555 [bacterium]